MTERPDPSNELVVFREGRCHVCQLGYDVVRYVAKLAAHGLSKREITRILNQWYDEGKISRPISTHSVSSHLDKHVDTKQRAYRKIQENEMAKLDAAYEENAMSIVNTLGFAKVLVQKGWEDLVDGKMQVSAKDALDAGKLVLAYQEKENQTLDAMAALAKINQILTVVQEVVPEKYWQEIRQKLEEQAERDVVYNVELES